MLERDHLDDNADLSPSPIAQEEYTGNPQAPHVRRLTERQDSFHSQSSSQPTLLQACEFSVDTSLGRPSITSPRSPDTDTRRTQSLNRLSDSSTMPRTVSTPPLGIVDFDRPSKYSTNSNALPASPSSLAGVLPSPPTASWDQLLSAPVEPNTSEQPRYDQPFIVPTTEQHYVPSHGKVTPALAGGTSSLNALEPKSRSPSTCTPAAKKAVPSTPPPIWSRRRGRTSKLGTPNSPGTSRTPPPHKLSTASVSRPSIMKRLKGRAR